MTAQKNTTGRPNVAAMPVVNLSKESLRSLCLIYFGLSLHLRRNGAPTVRTGFPAVFKGPSKKALVLPTSKRGARSCLFHST